MGKLSLAQFMRSRLASIALSYNYKLPSSLFIQQRPG
jgi:hypothetical protein